MKLKLSDVIKVEDALDPQGGRMGFFRACFQGFARVGSPDAKAHTPREAVFALIDNAICALRPIIYRFSKDGTVFALRQLNANRFSYDVVAPGYKHTYEFSSTCPQLALQRMEGHAAGYTGPVPIDDE